jgi:hypothetical protein
MTYKKNFYILLSLIAALALLYTASLIFDPEASGARSASYAWLDPKLVDRIDKITITDRGEIKELSKRDSQWFVAHNGKDYPARQMRVDDFTGVLSKRAPWPVRSSSADSYERLGLGEDAASRVTVYAGNTALVDLLLGIGDTTGREIYIRKAGQSEVRSGDNKIDSYVAGSVTSWYNLKLIPESENGKIDVGSVQRVTVYNRPDTQVFSRANNAWTVSGISVADPDQNSINSYVRAIINTEGDDFVDSVSGDDPLFGGGARIVLELDDGSIRTIRLSAPIDESGRRFASVTGSDYIYSLPSWVAGQFFKNAADFELQ